MILKLTILTSLGPDDPLTDVAHQTARTSDIYFTIDHSSKMTVSEVATKIILCVRGGCSPQHEELY